MDLVAIDANVIMVGECLALEHFASVSKRLPTNEVFHEGFLQ